MSGRTPAPHVGGRPADPDGAPKPGDKIGTYRLGALIGEGATGRVFEVEHLTIGRRAAMKILAPEHAERPGAIKRLFAEARAVNQINHPHIVEVTDLIEAGEDGDAGGVNAIVMELLVGESLAQTLAREGRLSPERFLPILAQVADALGAAHAARFIHRDLKPENIYLTTRGAQRDYVKLLDFGLAKSTSEELSGAMGPVTGARRSHATAEGTFVGTPAYASPEQASGKPLDNRTDIYSLGVILYELLCGKLPFEGRNFGEFLVKHLTEPVPPPPPDVLRSPVGRSLIAIARRCLAKDPEARWGSAIELQRMFERLARGEALDLPEEAQDRRSARGWLMGGAAAAILVATGIALVGGKPGGPSEAPAARTTATAHRRPEVVPLLPKRPARVRFVSEPPGAETRRIGSHTLLGVTPFHYTFPGDGSAVEFEMRLPGHAPWRETVILAADTTITVGGKLKRPSSRARRTAAPEERAEPAPPRSNVTRNTTLNPFSQ